PATTSILTSFFFGIAIGSLLGGKILERFKNTVFFYGLVELWIGITALAVPLLLFGVESLYLRIFGDLELNPAFSFGYRFFLSIAVVLPATIGMGATVPVMNRLVSEHGKGIGASVAWAYGINTFGAVTGCLLAGFVLVRFLGVQNTLFFAMTLNALVVLGAFRLMKGYTPAAGEQKAVPLDKPEAAAVTGRYSTFLVSVYFLSGFLALAYEITWLRLLAIFNSNSVLTFTTALSIYLFGFSLGSLAFYQFLARRVKGLTIFYLSLWGAGFFTLVLIPLYYYFPAVTHSLIYRNGGLSPSPGLNIAVSEFVVSGLMMFLPTLFLGLAFPSLCQTLVEAREKIGRRSGLFFFIGNIGAMLGVFITGLFIIPALGLVGTLGLLCALSLLLGIGVLMIHRDFPKRRLWQAGTLALVFFAVYYGVTGIPFVRSGFLVRDGSEFKYAIPKSEGRAKHIIRYKSGPTGTVVVENVRDDLWAPWRRRITIDGQGVASTHPGALVDSKMLAHIPLLLHPEPRNALTVGFGSGGTSWSMVTHGIDVYAAEIEPEVIRSAHLFTEQNNKVYEHPRFNLIMNDARDHLHTTSRLYDVISTDATNLQYKQNGNLYTKEYFELMKARLNKGGIACAWIPMDPVSREEFTILLRSFMEVFPYSSFWYMDHTRTNFGILIGTPEPLEIDLNRLIEGTSLPEVREDLARIQVDHPFQIVHFLYLDDVGLQRYLGSGPLHTDNRPVLEFHSQPHGLGSKRPLGDLIRPMMAHMPVDYKQYVTNLQNSQVELFDQYTRFSRSLGQLNINLHYSKGKTKAEEIQRLRKAMEGALGVLAVFPDHEEARRSAIIIDQEMRALISQ
ncbi:MAG TPA: fused MFS/spermidine synthase, partial [Nitrospiria bacterium]